MKKQDFDELQVYKEFGLLCLKLASILGISILFMLLGKIMKKEKELDFHQRAGKAVALIENSKEGLGYPEPYLHSSRPRKVRFYDTHYFDMPKDDKVDMIGDDDKKKPQDHDKDKLFTPPFQDKETEISPPYMPIIAQGQDMPTATERMEKEEKSVSTVAAIAPPATPAPIPAQEKAPTTAIMPQPWAPESATVAPKTIPDPKTAVVASASKTIPDPKTAVVASASKTPIASTPLPTAPERKFVPFGESRGFGDYMDRLANDMEEVDLSLYRELLISQNIPDISKVSLLNEDKETKRAMLAEKGEIKDEKPVDISLLTKTWRDFSRDGGNVHYVEYFNFLAGEI